MKSAAGFERLACVALFIGSVLLGFSGCKPAEQGAAELKEPVPSAKATATPEPVVDVIAAAPTEEPAPVDETIGSVESPQAIDMNLETLENQRIKEEVLKRIDVMPALSASDKDRLYMQVERARSMGKVITIPFAAGASRVSVDLISELEATLKQPQVRTLSDDPTVIFVILGFGDKMGDPAKNIEISTRRADSVLALLRDRFKLLNVMHPVGIGGSEMFDAADLDKNRVVEVWAVLP